MTGLPQNPDTVTEQQGLLTDSQQQVLQGLYAHESCFAV